MVQSITPDLSHLTHEQKAELRFRLEKRKEYANLSAVENSRMIERLRLQGDFCAFVKAAWPILQPGTELSWSWHYELIAEYLTQCAEKKLKRLIVNVPPRTLKSTLITIMFPVWVWTRTSNQSFVCASYADTLAEEHSVKRRRLIKSDWFQRLWGDRVWLQKDQDQKGKFQNNYEAQMFATSVGGSTTGMGGNYLIVDDSMKPNEIGSEPTVTTLHDWFDNTWRSRLNNRAEDVMIIVEQRVGEMDLSGHCLDGDKILTAKGDAPEWTHLCIPLEADAEAVDAVSLQQKFVFPISGRVKERPLGDVLQPDRNPPAVVAASKILRLTWSSQYQGRPSPLEGNMIKRADVCYYGGKNPTTGEDDPELPDKFDLILVSVDAAFKDTKTADFVCVGTVGVRGPNRYVLEVVTKHLDLPATEKETNRQRLARNVNVVLIEDKANGTAIIKSMRQNVAGIVEIDPQGGKISRMYACCGEWQSGNWYVDRNAAWCEPFVDHITKFPGIKNDDDVDMMTQAAAYIKRNTFVYGLTDYLKSEAEMAKKKAAARVQSTLPANATSEDIAKLDSPTNLTKPEIDDKTERCAECGNTFFQRIPGGKRCGQCGLQVMTNVLNKPASTDFGTFRK